MTKTSFQVSLDEGKIQISLESGLMIQIKETNHMRFSVKEQEAFLLAKKGKIKVIAVKSDKKNLPSLEFDTLLMIDASALDLEANQLKSYLLEEAERAGLALDVKLDRVKLPVNIYKTCEREMSPALLALSAFGYAFKKKKFVSPKAQHRWRKELSGLEFHLDYGGAKAQVIWPSAKELVIKAGATMVEKAPLLKDGSLGFGARFALTLREEHANAWDQTNYQTTKDIRLKSVNEMGHFLYFAGTNSWLQLFDDKERSLHELALVK